MAEHVYLDPQLHNKCAQEKYSLLFLCYIKDVFKKKSIPACFNWSKSSSMRTIDTLILLFSIESNISRLEVGVLFLSRNLLAIELYWSKLFDFYYYKKFSIFNIRSIWSGRWLNCCTSVCAIGVDVDTVSFQELILSVNLHITVCVTCMLMPYLAKYFPQIC